jgi:hypothetical protein
MQVDPLSLMEGRKDAGEHTSRARSGRLAVPHALLLAFFCQRMPLR